MTVKEKYEKLQKQHAQLPEFQRLDHEFEISTLEKDDFLLRAIKRKISDRIGDLIDTLDTLLHPDGNTFSSLYEYGGIESSKKDLMLIYKKLMALEREYDATTLTLSDSDDVAFIRHVFEVWPALRKSAAIYLQASKEHWEKSTETKAFLTYLG